MHWCSGSMISWIYRAISHGYGSRYVKLLSVHGCVCIRLVVAHIMIKGSISKPLPELEIVTLIIISHSDIKLRPPPLSLGACFRLEKPCS